MKIEEGEGKGTGGDIKNEVENELKGRRPVEPEEKYNHLLYLCLNKSEGHMKNFIVETLKTIGGEGEIVEGSDGEEYRAWDTMTEEDFGNVLFNVVMNLGMIYNKLCSGKEEDTIGELFETDKKKV
jgi:hypothetical protein